MGLKDKKYLMETYQSQIGKASVTSYCIKFKTLKDLDLSVLTTAIKDVSEKTSPGKWKVIRKEAKNAPFKAKLSQNRRFL